MSHDGLGAVVASAHGNAEAVEQSAHVEMVDVAQQEGDHGILLHRLAEDAQAGYSAKLLSGIGCELALVGVYSIKADALHEVQGHGQGVGSNVVGGAGLKLIGYSLKGGLVKADSADHLAASLIGRHLLQQTAAAIEHADAGGAIYLVAAERQEVAVQLLHVHPEMGHALSSIDHHGHPMAVGKAYHLPDRIDGAEHIADMGDAHHPRAVAEQ